MIYRDRVIHVASWAARFLFASEQLDQPVNKLSGGERARVLIANLMLEPADLLLLDEPTNDLDIPTLEILEESLLEFEGALVLVTHDRYLLDRVSTIVLGLDGSGQSPGASPTTRSGQPIRRAQVQAVRKQEKSKAPGAKRPKRRRRRSPRKRNCPTSKAASTNRSKQRLSAMEDAIHTKRASLQEIALKEPRLLEQLYHEIEASQQEIDLLYARWAELEDKVR